MINSVESSFCASHRLTNYEGKCNNLHGHTYKVVAEAYGDEKEDTQMVVDFHIMKHDLNEVLSKLDHSTLFSSTCRDNFDNELLTLLKEYNMKYNIIEGSRTTTENIARYILSSLPTYFTALTVSESDITHVRLTK